MDVVFLACVDTDTFHSLKDASAFLHAILLRKLGADEVDCIGIQAFKGAPKDFSS